MAVGTLETLDEVAMGDVPHVDALVEGASGNVLAVWRDGNRSDPVLYAESQEALSTLDVPEPDSPVSTPGSDGASVAGNVDRVDVLIVTGEGVANRSRLDIPDLVSSRSAFSYFSFAV